MTLSDTVSGTQGERQRFVPLSGAAPLGSKRRWKHQSKGARQGFFPVPRRISETIKRKTARTPRSLLHGKEALQFLTAIEQEEQVKPSSAPHRYESLESVRDQSYIASQLLVVSAGESVG